MKESFDAFVDYVMDSGLFLEQAVEIVEKSMIERAMLTTGGNRCEASKLLGIHRNTLQRKMTAYQIDGRRARRRPAGSADGPSARRPRRAS